MKNLISIIVPIFKAEEYLSKCINSILSQTYTNFELLLIDDGSPDNSGKICDEYASKDTRIRVFHKQNGGVSSARNLGLKEAKGEWICWVDADDWIENNMLELLVNKALQDFADMVMCDYKTIGLKYKDSTYCETNILGVSINNKLDLVKDSLSNLISGALWFKICKKDLYTKYNINFIEGADMIEDFSCSIKLIHYSSKITYVNEVLYNYNRLNMDSLSYYKDKKQICKMVDDSIINLNSVNDILLFYKQFRQEISHRWLIALAPYLEIDEKEMWIRWRKRCNVNLYRIIKDKYFPIGYRLKYSFAKLGLYGLYMNYVKLRNKMNHG